MDFNLGLYIAQIRASKRLSQREVARKAGVSLTAIQAIENGDTKSPGLEIILNLARALNVPVVNLIRAYQGKDPDIGTFDHLSIEGLSEQDRQELVDLVEFKRMRQAGIKNRNDALEALRRIDKRLEDME